jgi:type VI protein secretion system component VasK
MGGIRQFVVYTKITIIALIVLLLLVIVFNNRSYKTNFWPWADQQPVPTLWLMLATSILSILVFWIFTRLRRVFRELAQLRLENQQAHTVREQDRLRKELNDQERRIDEKLKRGVGTAPDNSQGHAGT